MNGSLIRIYLKSDKYLLWAIHTKEAEREMGNMSLVRVMHSIS